MNLLAKTTVSVATASIALSTATLLASAPAQALSFAVSTGSGPVDSWLGQPTSVITGFPQLAPTEPPSQAVVTSTNTALNGTATLISGPRSIYQTTADGFNVGQGTGSASTVTLQFERALSFIGFRWNSPSVGDRVELIVNGVIQGFNSASLDLTDGRYVSFSADPGESITGIMFMQAGTGTFQVRDVAYAVPTPALLPGLVAMGVGMLRKRKAETAVTEDTNA